MTNPFEELDEAEMERRMKEVVCLKKKTGKGGKQQEEVLSGGKGLGQVYNDQPRFLFAANIQQPRVKKEVASTPLQKAADRQEMELEFDSESQNVPEQSGSKHTQPPKQILKNHFDAEREEENKYLSRQQLHGLTNRSAAPLAANSPHSRNSS